MYDETKNSTYTISQPSDRAVLWQEIRALWFQDTSSATILPMLQRYVALTEAAEGKSVRSLIVPLRWLGLLHHILEQPDQERLILARCCDLMGQHLGFDHPQTVQCLILLLGVGDGDGDGEKAGAEQKQIALHYLASRQLVIDKMDPRLLQAFVHALDDDGLAQMSALRCDQNGLNKTRPLLTLVQP